MLLWGVGMFLGVPAGAVPQNAVHPGTVPLSTNSLNAPVPAGFDFILTWVSICELSFLLNSIKAALQKTWPHHTVRFTLLLG